MADKSHDRDGAAGGTGAQAAEASRRKRCLNRARTGGGGAPPAGGAGSRGSLEEAGEDALLEVVRNAQW